MTLIGALACFLSTEYVDLGVVSTNRANCTHMCICLNIKLDKYETHSTSSCFGIHWRRLTQHEFRANQILCKHMLTHVYILRVPLSLWEFTHRTWMWEAPKTTDDTVYKVHEVHTTGECVVRCEPCMACSCFAGQVCACIALCGSMHAPWWQTIVYWLYIVYIER